MENSMQEQTQNDKMVPIDTSGDPVEVTVNPEKTEEKKDLTEEIYDKIVRLGAQMTDAEAKEFVKMKKINDFIINCFCCI